MTLEPFILYDPEEGIELVFEKVLEGMEKSQVNEVINFRRYSDGQYESFTSSPGPREITITAITTDPSGTRRHLDYLRRSRGTGGLGKHLILMLSTFDFVSEVVIKNVEFIRTVGPEYPVAITFSCFGDIGKFVTAKDSRCAGIAETSDSDAIDG